MPDTQALNPNNNQNPGLLEEVALEDMLNARERRAAIQRSLLDEFHCPLVCLTLNIPGPVKVLDLSLIHIWFLPGPRSARRSFSAWRSP